VTLSADAEWRQEGSSFRLFGGIGHRRDYALTFLTEFATLGSTVLALKLAAVYWGTEGFGEYMLARRSLGLVQLPVLCGMGVAVTRYVARARAAGEGSSEYRYFAASVLVSLATAVLAGLVLNAASRPLAVVFFGSVRYDHLVRALSLAVAGMAFHGIAYGVFRGRVAMWQANALQALNLGIVPLAVLAWPGQSVPSVVIAVGGLWCLISGAAILIVLRSAPPTTWERRPIEAAMRELLRYGGPRVPGEFALGALFTFPVIVAAHVRGVATAGFVGLGVSLLTMMGSLFAPLGQIILPAVSALSVGRGRHRLRTDAWRLMALCLGVAAALVVSVEAGAALVIPRLFGAEFTPSVPVIRIMALGALPYVAYVVLRNILDALHTVPLNAKNLGLALALFLGLAVAIESSAGDSGIPWAFAVSLALLGGLSAFDAYRALSRLGEA
jgi:O-antigen/teichoic acid export membrane protein